MNKIIALILISLTIWSYCEIYKKNDPNRDMAYSILREKEKEYICGKIKRITPQDIKFNPTDTDFVKTKKEIISADFNLSEMQNKISKFDKQERILLSALVAIRCIRNNDVNNFNNFIIDSYISMLKMSTMERNPFVYEIIRNLASIDSKLPQEYAVLFLLKQNKTQDKFIHLYWLLSKKHSRNKLIYLSKTKNFRENNRLIYSIIQKSSLNLSKYYDSELEKLYFYTFSQFSMPWSIKKWGNYNYPFIAYICFLNNDIVRYKEYKEKSLSKEQLEDMKGGYFEYVEYASKIFCMTGDIDEAILLINTLPEGNKKNIILKHLARYLSLTPESTSKTLNSDIFKTATFIEKMNLEHLLGQ